MSSSPTLATLALQGRFVRLEPLSLADVPALLDAASEDRSSYGFTRVPSGPESMRAFVCKALDELAAGDAIPFTIRRQADSCRGQQPALEQRHRGVAAGQAVVRDQAGTLSLMGLCARYGAVHADGYPLFLILQGIVSPENVGPWL